jgi:hypothetical protein
VDTEATKAALTPAAVSKSISKTEKQQTLDAIQFGHATCMQIQIVVFGEDAGYMYPAMFPGLHMA